MRKFIILISVFAILFGVSFGVYKIFFYKPAYAVKTETFEVQQEVTPYEVSLDPKNLLKGYYFTDKSPLHIGDRVYIDSIGIQFKDLAFYKNPYKGLDSQGTETNSYFYALDFELLNYTEEVFEIDSKAISLNLDSAEKTTQIYASELEPETRMLDGAFVYGKVKGQHSRYGKVFFKLTEEEFKNAKSIKMQVNIEGSPIYFKIK